jgi:FLVCR family MFS transporter
VYCLARSVGEGLATGVLTVANNLACLAFLLVQNIPQIGTAWMNWSMAGACFVSLLAIVPLRERQKRLAVDMALNE